MTTRAQLRERDREMIPPILLKSMLALALGALGLTTFAVVTDHPHAGQQTMGGILAEAPVAFVRAADGVRITTPGGAETRAGAEAGFIDAYTDALTRKRELAGVDPALPVRVIALEDGRIIVVDPETGWRVDPRSFGPDSQGVFARFVEG
jgi:putative photosynthetic complex assembly protein